MSRNNIVILACRDPRKASEARRAIMLATGNVKVQTAQLDLASLASVREFAAECDRTLKQPIDALVCNAGVSSGPDRTADGIDGVFESNHLGHFLMTRLLRERMSPAGRVLVVSSDMHQPPGPALTWPGAEALAHPGPSAVARRRRYSYSKLCNLYFVYELARRLRAEDSSVVAAAFNPGPMTETNFATMPRPVGALMRRLFASRAGNLVDSGAALAKLAAAEAAAPIDGLYFDRDATAPKRSSQLSYNLENARDLWQLSDALTATSDRDSN